MHYFFDLYSKGYDTLYREPKDGMISLRKNYQQGDEQYQDVLPNKVVPSVELVTLIDMSTLWEDK